MPNTTLLSSGGLSRFWNRDGTSSWRVSGWLAGVRNRKNFKTREEAAAGKLVLESQFTAKASVLGLGDGVPTFAHASRSCEELAADAFRLAPKRAPATSTGPSDVSDYFVRITIPCAVPPDFQPDRTQSLTFAAGTGRERPPMGGSRCAAPH